MFTHRGCRGCAELARAVDHCGVGEVGRFITVSGLDVGRVYDAGVRWREEEYGVVLLGWGLRVGWVGRCVWMVLIALSKTLRAIKCMVNLDSFLRCI